MPPLRVGRLRTVLLGAGLLGSTAGCAPALKEPPPLPELSRQTDAAPAPPEAVAGLLAEASAAWSGRTLEATRTASDAWLRAAAADPSRVEGLLGAAEANVWLSDHEPTPEGRRAAAERAVSAAQWCARIAPAEAACSYWLGAGLGMAARERPSTGLSALPKIEEAFQRASRDAPELDAAGPFRALALLYLRAPGWPAGPGDPDRGLEMAREAVRRHPEYPPNQLALAEALGKTDDPSSAAEACRTAASEIETLGSSSAPPPSSVLADWRREAAECPQGSTQGS